MAMVRDLPKRAASPTPEDDCTQEELEKEIAFRQEELRKQIERGATGRTAPAEKSIYTSFSKNFIDAKPYRGQKE